MIFILAAGIKNLILQRLPPYKKMDRFVNGGKLI